MVTCVRIPQDGLVSALALCIELADARDAAHKRAQWEELQACVDAFSGAMLQCAQRYGARERLAVAGPFPTRIIGEHYLFIYTALAFTVVIIP